MTSALATNSLLFSALLNGTATTAYVNKRSGIPVEGQLPKSYQTDSGAIAAGAFNPFAEYHLLAAGTTIALNNADLKNIAGRHLVFKAPATAGVVTLTLPGTSPFNGGATPVATFDPALESCLSLFVTLSTLNVPQVYVESFRNVTFA